MLDVLILVLTVMFLGCELWEMGHDLRRERAKRCHKK